MSRIDKLLHEYERFITVPWQSNLSGSQKVIFAIYSPSEERIVRAKLPEFEMATRRVERGWVHQDLTSAFPAWLANDDYKERFFQQPERLKILLSEFKQSVVEEMTAVLTGEQVDSQTVVALSGLSSLFGFLHISDLVKDLTPQIQGRLLLFFPGDYDSNTYRFLDARDGWNYMAIPITA